MEEPAATEEDGVAEEEGKSAAPAAAEAGAALKEKLSQTAEVDMLDLQLAYLWRVHRVNYYVGGGLQDAAARGSRVLSRQLNIRFGMLGLRVLQRTASLLHCSQSAHAHSKH